MSDEQLNWLGKVLEAAEASRWCTRVNCTTCAASDAYVQGAADQAGIRLLPVRDPWPLRVLQQAPEPERRRVLEAILHGLRELPESLGMSYGVRLILTDLYPPLLKFGVPLALSSELGDSPAGVHLSVMEAHASDRRDRRSADQIRQDAATIARERGDVRRR